jgi:hypothetical protein
MDIAWYGVAASSSKVGAVIGTFLLSPAVAVTFLFAVEPNFDHFDR